MDGCLVLTFMPHYPDSSSLPLSPKQLEVLEFIRAFIQEHHSPPTRGEIVGRLRSQEPSGDRSTPAIRALEAKDAIELIAGISRGIRLREPALQIISEPDDRTLPLLGRIAAGSPIFGNQQCGRTIARGS